MIAASTTHLVLIPSYNPGAKVYETVRAARQYWTPVWVVVDGSTDGSAEGLLAMAAQDAGLRVIVLPRNQGKGAAVLHGLEQAAAAGFSHVLTMDSDGQHPPERIPAFMAESARQPAAMILGVPVFDASAPGLRVKGRRVSNWWANLETLWAGIGDSLFGFRVYPVEALRQVMRHQPWMRHFDFDPGGRGAPVLARGQAGQSARPGALLPRGGGRRVAFPLPARQRVIDLDAHAPVYRLCVALTRFAGKTCAGAILRAADRSGSLARIGLDRLVF